MKHIIQFHIVKSFLRALKRLEYGSMTLVTPNGATRTYAGTHDGPDAQLILYDWSVITNAAKRGDIGLGEDYIEGKWDSENIATLIELFCRNMAVFDSFAHGNMLNRAIFRAINAVRSNRKSQSKRNIKAHYDVGNAFYQLWLDDTMTYSSAIYHDDTQSLADAQRAKYQRILDKVSPEAAPAKVLEIGCGWGGFVEHASRLDHQVTAVTISHAQHEFATRRLSEQPLASPPAIQLQDYRDVRGKFDAIVSIEMFEAVGERYWPAYFSTIKNRLKEGGRAVIQTITIDDDFFDDYRTRSDFIRQYTFPGGMLPSVKKFREEAQRAGLACKEVFDFGLDYARTLQEWLSRFDAKRDEMLSMGYSEQFIRSWRFYMGMCIGAFAARRTSVVQVELAHA